MGKEGRGLFLTLVIALLAGRASASMFVLDESSAQQFRQQNSANPLENQLYIVIDSPGTPGSHINWQVSPDWSDYGSDGGIMELEVGFAGQLKNGQAIKIGMDGALPGGTYDSLGILVANDDDDYWAVRPYVTGATSTVPAPTILGPWSTALVTLTGISGTVTEFGFEVMISGTRGSDNFHISVTPDSPHTPVPGALALALFGMMGTLSLWRCRFV